MVETASRIHSARGGFSASQARALFFAGTFPGAILGNATIDDKSSSYRCLSVVFPPPSAFLEGSPLDKKFVILSARVGGPAALGLLGPFFASQRTKYVPLRRRAKGRCKLGRLETGRVERIQSTQFSTAIQPGSTHDEMRTHDGMETVGSSPPFCQQQPSQQPALSVAPPKQEALA